jgi:hypothetical protein
MAHSAEAVSAGSRVVWKAIVNLQAWITARAIGRRALNLDSETARTAYWQTVERDREAQIPWATRKVGVEFAYECGSVKQVILAGGARWFDGEFDVGRWYDTIAAINRSVAGSFARKVGATLKPVKGVHVFERKSLFTDLWQEYIENYIERAVAERVTQITATTRDAIKVQIQEGLQAGEGVYELAKRIDRLYLDEIIPHRSEVIARTEAVSASNAGSLAAARATRKAYDLEMTKVWISTPDSRTRAWHRAAGGQTRPLDEPFDVGGEQLMFPGDGSLGASGKNLVMCRCAQSFETV